MGVIHQMENPGPHVSFVEGNRRQEAEKGDAKYWADKLEEAAKCLTKLIEDGKIRKDDSGIGQAAYEFNIFLQKNKRTIRSRKISELFLEYIRESGSIYSDEFNAMVFLAKKFKEIEKNK